MTATIPYQQDRQERDTFGASAAYPPFLALGRGDCATYAFPDDFTEDGDLVVQRFMRERAREVCMGCPFRVPCDRWATGTHQQGMYGGRSTKERRNGVYPNAA